MTDITREITALAEWTIKELRAKWHEIHGSPPPPKMSRDLLTRAVAHYLQEGTLGCLDKKMARRLQRLVEGLETAKGGTSRPLSSPKAGTRYVREWHGKTYSVTTLSGGFEFNGKRYRSLSRIAREITGARWSGPRFFGLSESGVRHE